MPLNHATESQTSSTAPAENQPSETVTSQVDREPVTHYRSLSVDYQSPTANEPKRGSLEIVEHDFGDKHDLWNIHINLVWRPRGSVNAEVPTSVGTIKLSVDDLLTIRTQFTLRLPKLTVHLNGGALLGNFYFPNGPDAAMAFFHKLRDHIEPLELTDTFKAGDLYAIEKKRRMRRVAPSLSRQDRDQSDEDFSGLFNDLNISPPSRPLRARQTPNNGDDDFGMMILSHFARVTQAAREIGDNISTLLDEEKRRKEQERRQRELTARRRALDIYAEIVASTHEERELPPRLCLEEPKGVRVSPFNWRDSFDSDGKMKDVEVMKRAIFAGGIGSEIRPEVWPFLLGFFGWTSSSAEREDFARRKRIEFDQLKQKWQSALAVENGQTEKTTRENDQKASEEQKNMVSKAHADHINIKLQIEKDTVRTDRSIDMFKQDDSAGTAVMGTILNVYAMYDEKITYCQGMSDFLAPILYAFGIEDEALVFWCFQSLMQRIEANFRHDQSGIRRQLAKLRRLMDVADKQLAAFFKATDADYYTCFRWVLVRFKRELPFESTSRLWEALWTRQVGGDDLHIFIAAALLIAHRRQILKLEVGAFDQLLRYVNDMSMRIDEEFALREGEICFLKYGEHSHVVSS